MLSDTGNYRHAVSGSYKLIKYMGDRFKITLGSPCQRSQPNTVRLFRLELLFVFRFYTVHQAENKYSSTKELRLVGNK